MVPEDWFPAAPDILYPSPLTSRQEGKSHYRCEKRLREKKKKKERKRKRNSNKERFLFNPKGYFLAFSSLVKACLGVRAWVAGTGGGEGLLLSLLVPSCPVLPGAAGGSYPLESGAPSGSLGSCLSVTDHQQVFAQRTICKVGLSNPSCPQRHPPSFPLPKPTERTHRHRLKEGPGRKELPR